ncbi:MAG: hypothetical protein R3F11_21425 [Verrucomicrobiales bacterium]
MRGAVSVTRKDPPAAPASPSGCHSPAPPAREASRASIFKPAPAAPATDPRIGICPPARSLCWMTW